MPSAPAYRAAAEIVRELDVRVEPDANAVRGDGRAAPLGVGPAAGGDRRRCAATPARAPHRSGSTITSLADPSITTSCPG